LVALAGRDVSADYFAITAQAGGSHTNFLFVSKTQHHSSAGEEALSSLLRAGREAAHL
jgi:hypothetical protein